jgi:hypothetical protein
LKIADVALHRSTQTGRNRLTAMRCNGPGGRALAKTHPPRRKPLPRLIV